MITVMIIDPNDLHEVDLHKGDTINLTIDKHPLDIVMIDKNKIKIVIGEATNR